MARLPREWHAVALDLSRDDLEDAADYLLSIGLVEVRWDGDLGLWEYRLTAAGRRVARYMGYAQYVVTVRADGEDITVCTEAADKFQAAQRVTGACLRAGYLGAMVLRLTEV
jgi:hypothetical protein